MRIIFSIAALAYITSVNGQAMFEPRAYLGPDVDRVLLETATRLSDRANETRKTTEETEKGTYYLNTDFRPATVVLATNKKYKNVVSRYDALHDVLEIQHEGKVYILEGHKINSVVMYPERSDSMYFVHARFVEKGNKGGLYQVVVEGKKSLLKKTEVFVKKPDYVVQFNAGSQVTTYSLIDKYFLWNEDKTTVPLKSTRKGIITALGDHRDEIDAYLDRVVGKVADESTLRGVFLYYNSL
jgi:hypothetical protein